MTIEAALLFPMIFGICLIFIQLSLYFVTLEYAKAVSDRGLAIAHTDIPQGNMESQIDSYVDTTLKENSFITSVADIQVTQNNYWVFRTITIDVQGVFEMLYPIDFKVSAKGYATSPTQFCNLTDLVMQGASKLNEVIKEQGEE